jgi:hypothetical protein
VDDRGLLKAVRLKLGIRSSQANPERIRKMSAASRTFIMFTKNASFNTKAPAHPLLQIIPPPLSNECS